VLKKGLLAVLVLSMLVSGALAETVTVAEISTEIGENHVRYPQLEGMANSALQSRINDDIVLTSNASGHLITLVTLGQNPWQLKVDHQSSVLENRFFSTVISAKGKIGNQRDTHVYTALTYDLETGERISLSDLFTDVDAAVAYMEEKARQSLEDTLNGYLEYSDITPLPQESFTLDERGITFWYPYEQFSLLSGYAGAVQFWYEELEAFWKEPRTEALTAAEMKKAIEKSVSAGIIPRVNAEMGQSMKELTQTWRLLRTPDEFPGGRYYVLEDPSFRDILIISDALESDPARSVVEGIQLRRGSLHGLAIGKTNRQIWHEALGQPVESMIMTENMAYDYQLSQGSYDVYHFGSYELRLYADEADVLCAIQLCNK